MERLPVMKGLCSLVSLMIFNGLSKELRVSAHLVVKIICILVVVQDGCFVLYI